MPTSQNPEKLNPLALSRLDLASVLSRTGMAKLTPAAIGHWLDAGCPRNADQSYNIVHVCAWLAGKYGQTPYRPSAETDEEKKESIGLKRERRLAVRQARLERKGQLIEKEEFERECHRRNHMMKSGLLTLSRVLAREIEGRSAPEIQKIIEDRVREILMAYAEGWDGQGDEIPKEPTL
jgi:hypothetical protein